MSCHRTRTVLLSVIVACLVRVSADGARRPPLRRIRPILLATAPGAVADGPIAEPSLDPAVPSVRGGATPAPAPRRGLTLGRIVVAYLLWLLLPLTGTHLLYLGRNRAALLQSISCGGFGLGWLCDALFIPSYAAELSRAEAAGA